MLSRAVAVFFVLLAVAMRAAAEHPANGTGPVTAAIAAGLTGTVRFGWGHRTGRGGVRRADGAGSGHGRRGGAGAAHALPDGRLRADLADRPGGGGPASRRAGLLRRSDRHGLSRTTTSSWNWRRWRIGRPGIGGGARPADQCRRDALCRDIQAGRWSRRACGRGRDRLRSARHRQGGDGAGGRGGGRPVGVAWRRWRRTTGCLWGAARGAGRWRGRRSRGRLAPRSRPVPTLPPRRPERSGAGPAGAPGSQWRLLARGGGPRRRGDAGHGGRADGAASPLADSADSISADDRLGGGRSTF